MPDQKACLGLCFFDNQLFYAVNDIEREGYLKHIGAVDFNFDLLRILLQNNPDGIKGLSEKVQQLKEQFDVSRLRILLHATMECWATLPKIVQDSPKEREAYINILMNGHERTQIHPTWYSLSKEDFKLLQLRTDDALEGLKSVTGGTAEVDFISAFEIGEEWVEHVHPGGSFLTVGTFTNCITVSSFILGKLRGATFLKFDNPDDLPYLWLQKAEHLPWMLGLHEQIQVYGRQAHQFIDILEPFWDDAGVITKMDSLDKMKVRADEKTYGFDLSKAYPAIMLALNKML